MLGDYIKARTGSAISRSGFCGYSNIVRANDMYRVENHLQDASLLVDRMGAMRAWLDERRFEPDLFKFEHVGNAVIFRLEFKLASEAYAFVETFGGRVTEF